MPSQILRNGAVRWMGAKQRQLAGLARAPVTRRAHGRQSVLITNELFSFQDRIPGIPENERHLLLGTPKFRFGALRFIAHRPFSIPKQITISVEAGKWFVSFSFDNSSKEVLRTPAELAYEFNNLTDAQLQGAVVGYDRGVANRLMDSAGTDYPVDPAVAARIRRKDVRIRKY